MKPLCKWSGGKSREIKLFKQLYPQSFSTYIEPFVGGGAVFFDLNFSQNIISDVHNELINFYQQIKNGKSKELFNLMSSYKNNEETYYFVRDKFIPKNDVEKAFIFFYLRKTCFRGMLRYNKNGKFNIPFGRYKTYNYVELLNPEYEKLLKNTTILNKSFESLLNEFNNENNFVFLDPPYDSIFTDYGYCQFVKDNHLKLFEIFSKTKNKCLLIIGETEFVRELYKQYIVRSYEKNYAFKLYDGRIGKEIDNNHLIIKNY